MVHQSVIHARLNQIGVSLSRWYRPEIKELSTLLMDNEEIVSAVTGRYFGGYALLVATHQRLLLIDKKTMFMSLEDIRYDMISEIDYSARVFDATITIFTVNKQHRFVSIKHKTQMRHLTAYVQQRILEIRQPQSAQQLVREMDDEPEDYQVLAQNYQQAQVPSAIEPGAISYVPSVDPNRRRISQHLRGVGTAALRGSRSPVFNPYTQSSLNIQRTWPGFGMPAKPVAQDPTHSR